MGDRCLDFDGRDLAWLAVLGSVANGGVPLGLVVARLEELAADDLIDSGAVARYLQEMARGGQIVMATDGRKWTISPGPKAAASLARLMAIAPHPLARTRNEAFDRLARLFAPWQAAYAV